MRSVLALAIVACISATSFGERLPAKRSELAGTWVTDNYVYKLGRDGRYSVTLPDGRTRTGRWSILERHIIEMISDDDKEAGFYRMLKRTTDADGATSLVMAGPSYALTATPRRCPCTTFVRRK
ncbi:MAG: hypothetical protein HOV81_27640 [Kofleriaceae bacterium]|nr:hypothetical protein [Kofleriaceae bacterium]